MWTDTRHFASNKFGDCVCH